MNLEFLKTAPKPFFILIAGASCSGKTTLARKLANELEAYEPLLLCQDNWFCDLPNIPRAANGYLNLECAEAFCLEELRTAVLQLMQGKDILLPQYDVAANRRSGLQTVASRPVVILEGLHTILLFHRMLQNRHSIFVNTPKQVCCERRVLRDTRLFGIDAERVRTHFNEVIYPFYAPYIAPQREMADELV
ncbi:MAG: AAA family ATPase [Clostridia bacterium]|nr:AAA family ATPase [Clostridia bacterium]